MSKKMNAIAASLEPFQRGLSQKRLPHCLLFLIDFPKSLLSCLVQFNFAKTRNFSTDCGLSQVKNSAGASCDGRMTATAGKESAWDSESKWEEKAAWSKRSRIRRHLKKRGFRFPSMANRRKNEKNFEHFYSFVSKQNKSLCVLLVSLVCCFWRSGKKDLTNSFNFLFESLLLFGRKRQQRL